MRKICSSANTSCRLAFSATALREVGAERLLHDDARALDQAGLAAASRTADSAALGGTLR